MAINNLQIMNTGRSELWIRRGDLPHCVCLFPGRLPRGPLGLATLCVPFPSPLAAGALAKLWEIKELRGRGRDSVYAQGLTKASF